VSFDDFGGKLFSEYVFRRAEEACYVICNHLVSHILTSSQVSENKIVDY
jgi:hypothetical protein